MSNFLLCLGIGLFTLVFLCLYRGIFGPGVLNRIAAISAIGTKTLVILLITGFIYNRVDWHNHRSQIPGDRGGSLMDVFHIAAIPFFLAGFFFFFAATVGLLRFPDFYCRLHATGKGDTLAVLLSLIGLSLYFPLQA